jgi:hypothetical protein
MTGYDKIEELERKNRMNETTAVVPRAVARTVALTEARIAQIIDSLWGEAPQVEKGKAVMLCRDYGLNPLAKHIFLIPYHRHRDGKIVGTDWSMVLGIKAKRLIAYRRQGGFSYADNTPRLMSSEEQQMYFGEVDEKQIAAITVIVDSYGHRYPGYGRYSLADVPKGIEKGNSRANMAMIRSESAALERYAPGAMPDGITDVIDADYEVLPVVRDVRPEPLPEPAVKPVTETTAEDGIDNTGHVDIIDRDWVQESLKALGWKNRDCLEYLKNHCWLTDSASSVSEYLDKMTEKEQREFASEIQRRLKDAGL